MLNIAVGKGRLAETTMERLGEMGIVFPEYSKKSRKLIFTSENEEIRLVFVKATDVGIYVERGSCDLGVAGRDTLMESESNVYEMVDLGFGKCTFSVAAPRDYKQDQNKKMIVATKYPTVARKYFEKKGVPIEIIKINGSVELAPLMGLSDVIVDIVETGTTLKENGLVVTEVMHDISARLIVNKASLKTKKDEIMTVIKVLSVKE